MNIELHLRWFLAVSLILYSGALFGHEIPVHQAITANAAASAFNDSPDFSGFIAVVSSDRSLKQAEISMVNGSGFEDNIDIVGDVGGKRSMNHFYDPLDNIYGKGLSDSPPDHRIVTGTNSFVWASVSNCVGFNFPGVKVAWFDLGKNENTSNIWSWQNARGYEWLGLTATNRPARQTNLDNMFQAVGQVMHLLEDASQPQHVRNEQHLDTFAGIVITPWLSPIELYGKLHVLQLNYGDGSMLDWRGAGFTRLEDFWDRHRYAPGKVTVLASAEDGGAQLGMAEWCNGNFLGDRHQYADYYANTDIRYYPYPRRSGTITPSIDNLTFKNGHVVQRYYLDKTKDGISMTHHSALTLWGAEHPNMPIAKSTTIRDDNVLKDYHDNFIPKAVKYSAGLLDYFFRGIMTVSVGVDTNANLYTVTNINTSGFNFGNGNYYIFEEDTNGVRTLVQSTNMTTVLMTNASMTMSFSGPIVDNAQFLLVYQGTVGVDASGTPFDPVDAGIGIAITTFNFNQLIFDLSWSDPTAELDFYLVDPCGETLYEPDLYPNLISPCCSVVGGDDEDTGNTNQHMVVSNIRDGQYQLWVNYETGGSGPVNATLTTSSVPGGQLSTESFTLTTAATGQYGDGWPLGIVGPTTQDSWYIRKVITIQNGRPVAY